MRTIYWNFADQKDKDRFPVNKITAPANTFEFFQSPNPEEFHVDVFVKNGWQNQKLRDVLEDRKSLLSFLVIKSDTIVYQYQKEEIDESTELTSFSVSKSFLSVLYGIAYDQGLYQLGDPITKYLPELNDQEGFDRITIRHLLTHTSGIRFHESYISPINNDAAKFYYGKSVKKIISKLKIREEPGKSFQYQSANTQLLGLILIRVTGMPIAEYLEKNVWSQIGAEYDAKWSTYEKESIEKAFCCLTARAVDYAKFGRLILKEGQWEGKQIVSSEWLREATRQSHENGSLWKYQYHWLVGLKEYGDVMAQGLYDQFIYVMPEKEVVIVLFQDFHRPRTNWPDIFRQIVDQL